MADRWGQLGWTVQSTPSVLSDNSNLAPWQIPADIETVNVHGDVHSISGGRATGYVEFEIQPVGTSLKYLTTDSTLVDTKFTAFFNALGYLSINIPATDASQLLPNGFQYKVTIVYNHRVAKTFLTSLPKATPSVNLADLAA